MTPSIIGHTTPITNSNPPTFTLDPTANLVGGSVATDDWILLVLTSATNQANTVPPTAPGDWTELVAWGSVGAGNMTFGLWAHQRAVGESTYTWSQSPGPSNGTYQRMIFIRNADDIANWVIGTFNIRATNGTSTTNVGDSITTTVDNSLGVAISAERTIASETDGQVTCDNFTKEYFENIVDHSIFIASKTITPAGSTGSVTITYPNTQTNNGIAGLLGIPGLQSSTTIPLMWVQGVNT